MDEATSALDNETEREIIEEIWVLKGTKTLVVIAHRLTTLQHCDRIYRLKKGRIVELGTYEEAMQQAPGAPNLHGRHPSAPQSGGELRLDYARQ
jgi:ABC-type bacteriocin/lantibiotic exporter with double-glycine peptidase domain